VDASRYEAVSGQKWYNENGLAFPAGEKAGVPPESPNDGSFRSRFGPCVQFKIVVHANTNLTINRAFNGRLLHIRDGEEAYRTAQAAFIALHLDSEIHRHLRTAFNAEYEPADFMTDVIAHIHDPHPKKKAREEAMANIIDEGISSEELWLINHRVKMKLKKSELAKFGKVGRVIADLGVAASLVGYRITHNMKDAMARPFCLSGRSEFEFLIAPSAEGLQRVFDRLIAPPLESYFVYFSDDSCYAVRYNGRVYQFNVDISKCDMSHTPALFELLYHLTPPHDQPNMRRLIQQCAADLVITAPESRLGRCKVRLRSKGGAPRLLSGSTLTTLINNIACLLIYQSFLYITGEPTEAKLISAAATCGYIITAAVCNKPEEIQFLKYSPCMDPDARY
jgi:hypothetical protein